MKKILFIAFMFSVQFGYSATGSGNDGYLLIFSIVGVLTAILAVLYSISQIKKYLKLCKERKMNGEMLEENESKT